MAKLTLADLENLNNETTAVAAINSNGALIEAAIEKTLSRDGTTPNSMSAPLDMNSQRIFNLPEPISATEPVRKQDLEEAVLGDLSLPETHEFYVESFGAVGDFTTDCSDAFEDARDYVYAQWALGQIVVLRLGPGVFRTTREISFRNADCPINLIGAGRNHTAIYGDFTGAGSFIFDFGRDADESSVPGHVLKGMTFQGNDVAGDPVAVGLENPLLATIEDIGVTLRNFAGSPGSRLANSLLYIRNDNNSTYKDIVSRAGHQPFKFIYSKNVTCGLVESDNTVVFSSGIITTAMVGETIVFETNSNNGMFSTTIASRTNSTTVELTDPAPYTQELTHFHIGLIRGSIDAATKKIVTFDAPVAEIAANPSAYVGMSIHINKARNNTAGTDEIDALCSTYIETVEADGSGVTLTAAADIDVVDELIWFAPNIFLGSTQDDNINKQVNHSWWSNIDLEHTQCAGIIMNRVFMTVFDRLKLVAEPYDASDFGRTVNMLVLSEVKDLMLRDIIAIGSCIPEVIYITGSHGKLDYDALRISYIHIDEPPIVAEECGDSFLLVPGTTYLSNGTRIAGSSNGFASTWSPWSVPAPHNLDGRRSRVYDIDDKEWTPGRVRFGVQGRFKGPDITVASGVLTVTHEYHQVAGEGASADDVDTISGGYGGQFLTLRPASTDVTITMKDATGNLRLAGDCTMDSIRDTILLQYDDTNELWYELSRSGNGS